MNADLKNSSTMRDFLEHFFHGEVLRVKRKIFVSKTVGMLDRRRCFARWGSWRVERGPVLQHGKNLFSTCDTSYCINAYCNTGSQRLSEQLSHQDSKQHVRAAIWYAPSHTRPVKAECFCYIFEILIFHPRHMMYRLFLAYSETSDANLKLCLQDRQ